MYAVAVVLYQKSVSTFRS